MTYLTRQEARIKTIERKQDTRLKIQLGELVKKAGLDQEDRVVIFGLLLEAVEKLEGNQAEQQRQAWKNRGVSTVNMSQP